MRLRRSLLVLGFALAGCDAAQHPFADDRPSSDAPILQVRDSAGVVVEPVAGTPGGAALAEAMASALRDLEVPASTGAGNRHSQHLTGTAVAEPGAGSVGLTISWHLHEADGGDGGGDEQRARVPAAIWQAATPDGFKDLAAAEAPRLVSLIAGAPPAEHKPAQSVYVRAVSGAPGDGSRALASALSYLLKQRGYTVADLDVGAVVVAGEVQLTPGDGKDHVKITWHVLKPDGTDIAQVGQENDVPHGALDGRWGETAMAVALAGIDDIAKLVTAALNGS